MSEKITCPSCNMKLKVTSANRCSYCGKSLAESASSEISSDMGTSQQHSPTKLYSKAQQQSAAQGYDLVIAQNRTTYAVRAIALFFFIQVQTAFLGGALIGWATTLGSEGSGLLFAGFLVIVVGIAISIFVGYSELRKSEP